MAWSEGISSELESYRLFPEVYLLNLIVIKQLMGMLSSGQSEWRFVRYGKRIKIGAAYLHTHYSLDQDIDYDDIGFLKLDHEAGSVLIYGSGGWFSGEDGPNYEWLDESRIITRGLVEEWLQNHCQVSARMVPRGDNVIDWEG